MKKEPTQAELQEAEIRMRQIMASKGHQLPERPKTPIEKHFTREEHLKMAYVPVVVAESIWAYVDKVLDFCTRNRIQAVKKLTRQVKELRDSYYDFLRGSIDSDHLRRAKECADDFQATFARDMAVMWFTINNELKKKYPDMMYDEMRTDALCAILLVRLVKLFCGNADVEIMRRTNLEHVHTLNPKLRYLDEIMDAYLGNHEIDRTELIRRCEIILRRAMETIKYTEDTEE